VRAGLVRTRGSDRPARDRLPASDRLPEGAVADRPVVRRDPRVVVRGVLRAVRRDRPGPAAGGPGTVPVRPVRPGVGAAAAAEPGRAGVPRAVHRARDGGGMTAPLPGRVAAGLRGEADVADLAAFCTRVLRLDPHGLVRLRQAEDRLTAYGRVLDVLVSRTVHS